MISAFVFINCRFQFNDRVIEELSKLPFISHMYRTSGIYDIIIEGSIQLNSITDKALTETMIRDIRGVDNVDSTMTLMIADDK
jgi:DNA-binding Lrp family transcriptional regulator